MWTWNLSTQQNLPCTPQSHAVLQNGPASELIASSSDRSHKREAYKQFVIAKDFIINVSFQNIWMQMYEVLTELVIKWVVNSFELADC